MQYSEKFKGRMVVKMVGPLGQSASSLASEVGVSKSTLCKWLRDSVEAVSKPSDAQVPSKPLSELEPFERVRLVVEAAGLDAEALGGFMRTHGLHETDVAESRKWLDERIAHRTPVRETPAERKARRKDKERIQVLERELRRKDKALAETAALLVLKKKVEQLWGDEDDDMTSTNGPRS
jgi:transposase